MRVMDTRALQTPSVFPPGARSEDPLAPGLVFTVLTDVTCLLRDTLPSSSFLPFSSAVCFADFTVPVGLLLMAVPPYDGIKLTLKNARRRLWFLSPAFRQSAEPIVSRYVVPRLQQQSEGNNSMNSIIYLVGLIVVVMFILSLLGLA